MVRINTLEPDHRILWKPLDSCVPAGGLFLDVWLPKSITSSAPCPVNFMIHGGGFTTGASTDVPENQLEWFGDRGVVCVSSEYRLLPHVNHMDQRRDVLDAYKWIHSDLCQTQKSLGSTIVVDLSRCSIGGSSAGGINSLWLAIDILWANKEEGVRLPVPKCVLSAYPLVDLERPQLSRPKCALEEFLKDNPETQNAIRKAYSEPVCVSETFCDIEGVDPQQRRQRIWFQAALDSRCLASWMTGCQDGPPYPTETSLLENLSEAFPPTWLYCALRDTLIPYEDTYIVYDRLTNLSVECEMAKSDAPHGFVESFAAATAVMGVTEEVSQLWYEEFILPSMEWAMTKLR